MKQNILTVGVFVILIGLFAFAANDWKAPWAGKPVHGQDWCEAHQTALSTCEKCNPKLARGGTFTIREREPKPGECPNTLVRVTLGPGVAEQVHLQFHTLETREVTETIRANAETLYPPAQYARVAPRIAGVIREVKVILGQDVDAGETLVVLESPDFGQAKGDYLQAISLLNLRQERYSQEKALAEKKITTGRELLQAGVDFEEAKLAQRRSAQKLSALGVPAESLKELAEKQDTSSLLSVVAPFKGRVVEALAVPGEMATPEKPIFAVAATERMWVSIDVYESELGKLEKDQRVVFTVEGLPGQRFPGKVVAIGGEVDDKTRTVRVFADVKNVQGLLRAKMFGRAEISIKAAEPKVLVPKNAVQNDGDCRLVFVSPTPNIFQARKIEIGAVYENGYELVGGLAAGEKVVTIGSFLLKTEVMRGEMGAG
jgi:cobalt-zinc-cadmium efflux system membrane fusion protein